MVASGKSRNLVSLESLVNELVTQIFVEILVLESSSPSSQPFCNGDTLFSSALLRGSCGNAL
jgi:hypothetical protein